MKEIRQTQQYQDQTQLERMKEANRTTLNADKNAIESKQIELYACLDRYEYKGYKNSKLTMWLSYKY
jgi:peroxiredoxin family protein